MSPNIKRLFSLRMLLMIALVGTILYVILTPRVLYKDCNPYRVTRHETKYTGNIIALMPWIEQPNVLALSFNNYSILAHCINLKTGSRPEMMLTNYGGLPSLYVDEEDQRVYTVLRNRRNDVWDIVALSLAERGNIEFEACNIFADTLFASLQDSIITIHGVDFLPYRVLREGPQAKLIDDADGIRLAYHVSLLDSLRVLRPEKVESIDVLVDLAAMLREKTGKPFDERNVYRLIQTYRRNSYYRTQYLEKDGNYQGSINTSRIVLRKDINGDGTREFFIAFHGDQFINQRLLCFNPAIDSVLWTVIIPAALTDIFVEDVNGNGMMEIGICTHAPAGQESPNWFLADAIGSRQRSSFTLLDVEGNINLCGSTALDFTFGWFRSVMLAVPIVPS